MIKIIVLIILCSQILFGFSMGNYLFPEIPFRDVQLKEINKDSTIKIIRGLKEYKRIFGLTDLLDTVNHFYLSDIDNDNTNELIYHGLISAEGKWTIIWKVENSTYSLFGELFGRINGISDSLYIATSGSGCCNSNCDYANLYHITDDAIDFQYSVLMFKREINPDLLFLHARKTEAIKIPDTSMPIRKNIIINNIRYNVRSQPVINDNPDSTEIDRYGVLRGNVIVELGKGTAVMITAVYKDNIGRVWWFIVLENPPAAPYNVYDRCRKEQKRICGWVQAKFIEYKENYR